MCSSMFNECSVKAQGPQPHRRVVDGVDLGYLLPFAADENPHGLTENCRRAVELREEN